MTINIRAIAPVLDPTGYGENARNLLLSLYRMNEFNIGVNPYSASSVPENLGDEDRLHLARMTNNHLVNPDVGISFLIAPQFNKSAKVNIGYSAFETDRIPYNWVNHCNQMDAICVPSDHNKDSFVKSGVDSSRVHVVPHAPSYSKDYIAEPIEYLMDKKNFLVCGSIDHRKGVDIAIKAFIEIFDTHNIKDVRLIIKTNLGYNRSLLDSYLDNIRSQLGTNGPEIMLISHNLDKHTLARLYKSCEALLLPSRGEGWGLTGSDAVSLGVPVVTTDWSGPKMYIKDDSMGYLIKYKMDPVSKMEWNPQYEIAQAEGHLWAKPDVYHLIDILDDIYHNPNKAIMKASLAKENLYNTYNWSKSAKLLANIIKSKV